jgi:hypothetical protein
MLYVMLFGQYPFETQQPNGPKMEPDRRIRTMMDRIVNMQVGGRSLAAAAAVSVGHVFCGAWQSLGNGVSHDQGVLDIRPGDRADALVCVRVCCASPSPPAAAAGSAHSGPFPPTLRSARSAATC